MFCSLGGGSVARSDFVHQDIMSRHGMPNGLTSRCLSSENSCFFLFVHARRPNFDGHQVHVIVLHPDLRFGVFDA